MTMLIRPIALAGTLLSTSCAATTTTTMLPADRFEQARREGMYTVERARVQMEWRGARGSERQELEARLGELDCEERIAIVNPLLRDGNLPMSLDNLIEGDAAAVVFGDLAACKGSEALVAEARRIQEAVFEASLAGMRAKAEDAAINGRRFRERDYLLSLIREMFPPRVIANRDARLNALVVRLDATATQAFDRIGPSKKSAVEAALAKGAFDDAEKALSGLISLARDIEKERPAAMTEALALEKRVRRAQVAHWRERVAAGDPAGVEGLSHMIRLMGLDSELAKEIEAALESALAAEWREVDALEARGALRQAEAKAKELVEKQYSSAAAQRRIDALRQRAASTYSAKAEKASTTTAKWLYLQLAASYGASTPERDALRSKLAAILAPPIRIAVVADAACGGLVTPKTPPGEGTAVADVRVELRSCGFNEKTREENVELRSTVSVPHTVTRYRTQQKRVCRDEYQSHCPGKPTDYSCQGSYQQVCRYVDEQVPYTEREYQNEVRTELRKERLRSLTGRVDGTITTSVGTNRTSQNTNIALERDEKNYLEQEQRAQFSRMSLADVRKEATGLIEQDIANTLAQLWRQRDARLIEDAVAAEGAGNTDRAEELYVLHALQTRTLQPATAAFLGKRLGLDIADIAVAFAAEQKQANVMK